MKEKPIKNLQIYTKKSLIYKEVLKVKKIIPFLLLFGVFFVLNGHEGNTIPQDPVIQPQSEADYPPET